MSVGRPETDPHFMWSLEFGDFAQDFVGHNLDDNMDSLSLCELEGDELFCRCQRRCLDARYNILERPIALKITDIFWDYSS
jgi:hypothetical protein